MMIKCVRAVMGAAAAAALVIGLDVTPVAAATATWSITPGGTFYTFTESATPRLTDATTGARFPCSTDFYISGTLKSGTGLADPIATIATATGSGGPERLLLCTGNGLQLMLTFSGLPWPVRALRYDSAGPGTTSGVLTGVTGRIASYSGPSCRAVIDGTAPGTAGRIRFTYANTGDFTLTGAGNLHFYNVSGCNGHINTGDAMTYTAPPLLIKADGSHAINVITSP